MSHQDHNGDLQEIDLSKQTLHTPYISEIDLSRIKDSSDKLLLTLILGSEGSFVVEAKSYKIDKKYLICKMREFLDKLDQNS